MDLRDKIEMDFGRFKIGCKTTPDQLLTAQLSLLTMDARFAETVPRCKSYVLLVFYCCATR